MKNFLAAVCIATLILSLSAEAFGADDSARAAAFYKGKNIDFTINEAAGGGADLVARLMGPYLKEHMGVTPIFANRRGAGGVEGYVYVYKAAPDGLTIGAAMTSPMLLSKVTDAPGAIYEPDRFGYAGSFLRVRNVFVVAANSPYKTVADLRKAKKLVLGGTSPQGNISLATMSSAKLLGLDAKVITGTKGAGPLLQDVLSGEITGTCIPLEAAMRGIRDGNYRALFTLANERFKAMPEIPSLKEVYNMEGDEEKKTLMAIWDQSLAFSVAIITPPGVSKEKLDFLRELFPKLKKSPQFRKDLDRIFAFHVDDSDILSGPEVEKLVKDAMARAGKMKTFFQQMLTDYRL
jgi:tripartite-type tricarboxylate transporter receptor subunit TctC